MINKKRSLLLLIIAMFLLVLKACNETMTDSEYVKSKNQLRVGITIYPPMDFYNEDETDYIGFDADLAKMFAEELGVNVKFVLITWNQKVLELDSKEIDCIWNGMTGSEELGKNIDQSISYATNMQCVVVKKGTASNFDTTDKLKNSKLVVEAGSAGNKVVNNVLGKTNEQISCVKGQVNALIEVKSNASDAAVIDYTMAYNLVGKGDYADLEIVDINKVSFEKEEFVVGFRKGSDLTAMLNKFLKEKYQDGTMQSLIDKYGAVALNEEKLK